MSSFGARLKHERESRGVTLREISAATNVGLHLLEALETNDFKSLPGGPFNKGFVRAYARHLGIDAEAAVDAYGREEKALGLSTPDAHRQEESTQEEVKLFEMRREGQRTTVILDMVLVQRILMGAGALLIILLLTWVLWPSGQPQDPAAATAAGTSPVPPSSPGETRPAGPALPPAEPAEQPANSAGGEAVAPAESPPTQSPAPQDRQITTPQEDAGDAATEATPRRLDAPSTPPAGVEPAPAVEPSDSHLSITEHGVGTGVSNRMLTGRSDRFTVGTQVWFWTRTLGGTQGEVITHVWMHEDGQTITYDRSLGGAHWRNSSRKSLISTSVGRWVVEARDSSGRVLARSAFRCDAP